MEYLSKNTVIRIINHQKIIPLFEREYLQAHIKLEKAADVAEVKHGEWTKVEVMGNGYGRIYYQHKECPVSSTELFTCPYECCPRCGAKMDGGKAE